MTTKRTHPHIFSTLFLLVLLTGLCLLQAVQAAPIYLRATDTQITISGEQSLHPTPQAQYRTIDITLQDAQARITYLSAAIARHARFILPVLDYTYTFNSHTGRVDITPAGTAQPMLSLPVDRFGRTAPVKRSGESEFKALQVDAETLHITQVPTSLRDPNLLSFDVADGANLLVTEQTAALRYAQPRLRDAHTPPPLPEFVFDQNPTPALNPQANPRQTGSANTSLFVVDSQGQLRPALHSSLNAQVLYALLSHDQRSFYVALDPGFDQDGLLELRSGHTDTTRLVAQLDCALFEVSLHDNHYECIDPLYLPVPMTAAFRRVVSDGERKPLQLDAEGNLYYLGYPFERRYDEREGEYVFLRAETTPQLRRYSKAAGEVRDLTPDVAQIGQFMVLRDGALVYTDTSSNSLRLVSFVDGRPVTNALSDLRQTDRDAVFFTVDEGNTVLFGASSGAEGTRGIQFGQRHPNDPDMRRLKQLDTSLFATTDGQQPTPTRILMADDGYVYALFTQADRSLQLFRILPYLPDPILTLPPTLLDTNIQISKGHLYYMETDEHPAGSFGDRHIIQVHRLADGRTLPLLASTNWREQRYEIFNWRLSGDMLTFSAFNHAVSEVIIGEINTLEVRRSGNPEQALNLQSVGSARGASARIRDIEVLRPIIPEQDYGGDPEVVEVFTDPQNRYSVSVEFSKHMKVEDINQYLQVMDANGRLVDSLKVWQHRVVHLILDKDPDVRDTIPLDPGSQYTITLPAGGTIRDRYNWGLMTGINQSFTTAAIGETPRVTVTASAGTGGSISPATQTVAHGNTTTFTVTPNTGYTIDTVTGCNGSLSGNTYTTGSITGTCTVNASFQQLPPPVPQNLVAVAGDQSVQLSWNAVSGVSSYVLYYGTDPNIHPHVNNSYMQRVVLANVTQHSVTGLNNATTYYFVLTSLGNNIESSPSTVVSATPQAATAQLIAGRYLPIEDGSVIRDITTNLEWQRCSVGQTWNATQQSCDGEVSRFNWDDAIQLTAPGGFRTPDITELRSLVYCSTGQPQEFGMDADYTFCSSDYQHPTIVTEAFPNTLNWFFWSASPLAGHSYGAWFVDFGDGGVAYGYKNDGPAVRLVRGGQ